MVPQYLVGQKIVTGFMALLFLMNMSLFGNKTPEVKAKIYNHQEQIGYVDFYGTFTIDGEDCPMIVSVEVDEQSITQNQNIYKEEYKKEDKTYQEQKNKNEQINKNSENIIIRDDRTPGRMKIKIKTRHGDIVEVDDDIGSGERSEFEQECKKEIITEVRDYLAEIKNEMRNSNTSLWNKLDKTVNGFLRYVNEENKPKSKFRLPWFK